MTDFQVEVTRLIAAVRELAERGVRAGAEADRLRSELALARKDLAGLLGDRDALRRRADRYEKALRQIGSFQFDPEDGIQEDDYPEAGPIAREALEPTR